MPIEDRIKKHVPFLSNVMVIGDHRNFLTCLVTLKVEREREDGERQREKTERDKR